MKKLILALMIFTSTKAFAAGPQFGCNAKFADKSGNEMEMGFDQESGGIGEAYLIKQNPKAPLFKSVHKFRSYSGDTSVSVIVKEIRGTSKTTKRNGRVSRSFDAKFAVDLDGDKMLFRGSCIEIVKK
jgi:hypothetical protein